MSATDEQPTVTICSGSETLFTCRSPHTDNVSSSSLERTAALVLALDYIKVQVNEFLTNFIARQGESLEDVSDTDSSDSQNEDLSSENTESGKRSTIMQVNIGTAPKKSKSM